MVNKRKHSVLWQITPPQGGKLSYLLGTVHLGAGFVLERLPRYRDLIRQCAAYAGETDVDALTDSPVPAAMDSAYRDLYPRVLSGTQLRFLQRYLHPHFPFSEQWMSLHPVSLISVLSEIVLQAEGQPPLDKLLWDYAKSLGLPTFAVEPPQQQYALFADLDLDVSFKQLKRVVSGFDSFRKRMKKVARLYAEQDIFLLHRILKRDLGKFRRTLLYARNDSMAESIAGLVTAQPTFVSIGAGHLAGGKGVLRLLKRKGFTVKPETSLNYTQSDWSGDGKNIEQGTPI